MSHTCATISLHSLSSFLALNSGASEDGRDTNFPFDCQLNCQTSFRDYSDLSITLSLIMLLFGIDLEIHCIVKDVLGINNI